MPNAKERNEGAYENPEDTAIYQSIGLTVDVYEDLQKPTEDKFQGSQNVRNRRRTVAVGLGLLTLLLLAGITGLGIHYFLEKTDWGVERGLLWECANLSSAQDQIQASNDKKVKSENYKLTQRISQSEEEVAHLQAVNSFLQAVNSHLQAVNSNITAQRDELQERLDGRKCCPGWQKFGNHCYYVSNSTKTRGESKTDCENWDAYLVIITSKEEQEFISGLRVNAWIGLDRQEDGEHWKWVDGSPLTTGYWGPNEPNNYKNRDEACVEIHGVHFLWNDYVCGNLRRWICKKEI